VERFAPAMAVLLIVTFAAWAWFASRGTRLQFDELLELSASSAPTSGQVLSYLAAGVDFNPPLSHLLVRASMSLFGDTELAARLPAFVGVVLLLICLYSLLSRQFTRSYGVMAMLAILCLPVRDYAVQARPYGLVLGFSALALICYRNACQRGDRALALIGLAGCSAALVASHYYAALVIGVILAAELARTWELRRVDWPVLVCCAAPALAVLWSLRHAMSQQRQQIAHYFSRGNLLSFDHGFDVLAMDPVVYCVALVFVIIAIEFHWRGTQVQTPAAAAIGLPLRDITLGAGLLLLPVIGAVVSQFVTHAYVPRYFLPAAVGFAICLCYAVRVFSRVVAGLLLLLTVSFALGFGITLTRQVLRPVEGLPSLEALTAEQTPLLFDTPANYEQIYHYFPSLRNNMWVIVDPAASMRYRQYDSDDKIMLALAGLGKAQAISLSEAVRRWPQFRLIPRSADYIWALKCVMDSGSLITVKHPFGNSNFIFNVSVAPEGVGQIDACAQSKLL